MTKTALVASSCALFAVRLAAAAEPNCPDDWEKSKRGGCWLTTDVFSGKKEDYFVHQGGWLVRSNCFDRFGRDSFLSDLDAARRKIDPRFAPEQGGCMSQFNPERGKEWSEDLWGRHIVLTCDHPEYDTSGCANESDWSGYFRDDKGNLKEIPKFYRLVSIEKAGPCLDKYGPGMPGILFHETLHALDVHMHPDHNRAWKLPQSDFVTDDVYGAEAVCFFGVVPKLRRFVNTVQCAHLVADDRQDICDEFDASFTNLAPPRGFIAHGGPSP